MQNNTKAEQLLKALKKDEPRTSGRLKIFFGYCAGVGKTYAMLKAAHEAASKGANILIGYIEPHGRVHTEALIQGLESVPPLNLTYKSINLQELDVDKVLKRKPEIVLVDELAHTNAEGSRHTKRYQDIEELLHAGIDVWTTLNVQHIESLHDKVASITGVFVKERVPDSVFDSADQVELVDIEAPALIARLKEGLIYPKDRAQRALKSFFTLENLTALREIALRKCADKINILSEQERIKKHKDYHTEEHLLVCLNAKRSNANIIRAAATMAKAMNARLSALLIKTPEFENLSKAERAILNENTHLAEQFGARLEIVYGDDEAQQIINFVQISNISTFITGRSALAKTPFSASLASKISNAAPLLNIQVVPDNEPLKTSLSRRSLASLNLEKPEFIFSLKDTLKSLLVLAFATLLGRVFEYFDFAVANIIIVFVLAVLVISIITARFIYSLISSALAVLVFNFFFTEPRFTLNFPQGYIITFIIMFLAAFLCASLANRLKNHAKNAAASAYKTRVLLETNHLLQKAHTKEEIISVTARQLIKLLKKDIIFYFAENNALSEPYAFSASGESVDKHYLSAHEQAVAQWVYKNNKPAGAMSETLRDAACLYFSVCVDKKVYGVLGIANNDKPLEFFEKSMLFSLLAECALMLESEQNAKEKQAAAILAKNEKLRSNLLRTISHDLRTPLTSISGNANNLLHQNFDEKTRKRLYKDIYEDALWLIDLVENILSITRFKQGKIELSLKPEVLDELILEALRHIRNESHELVFEESSEVLLVSVDAKLIVQVLINIISNALAYTPASTTIKITTQKRANKAVVSISDEGEGIEDKSKIFEMFYSGANKFADSRRSLGLGLYLCKNIIKAHKGSIFVKDNKPKGSIFSFILPLKEDYA